jgi:hypothetical protein
VINQTTVIQQHITRVSATSSSVDFSAGVHGGHAPDPLAQTFMLTEGRCVTAVRLKCAGKGFASNAVFVQLVRRQHQ